MAGLMRSGKPARTRTRIKIKARLHRLNRREDSVPHSPIIYRCSSQMIGNGTISPGRVIPPGCRLSRMASTMSSARRSRRKAQDELIFSAAANSSIAAVAARYRIRPHSTTTLALAASSAPKAFPD